MTRIIVIGNHGQFTHLEQHALRDLGVDTELVDNDTDPADIDADGIVLSGGPDMDRIGRYPDYLDFDVPVLGICLGMQILAEEPDGRVGSGDYGGYADVDAEILDEDDPLVDSLAPETRVWAGHADEIKEAPEGFIHTVTSDVCTIEAMSDADRDLYGVQWHPEVAHTAEDEEVFENFIDICEWQPVAERSVTFDRDRVLRDDWLSAPSLQRETAIRRHDEVSHGRSSETSRDIYRPPFCLFEK